MRITTRTIQQRLTATLRSQLEAQAAASGQVSSGLRWSRPSEAPAAASRVLRVDHAMRGVDQYRRSIQSVRSRLDAEEGAIDQMTDILTRAKELGISQGGSSANAGSRAASAAELRSLFDQVVAMGNLRVGNEYLFGGLATATPPFAADGSYSGTAASRQAETGAGVITDTVHSGQELLVDTNVLGALGALLAGMTADSAAGIQAALPAIDDALVALQSRFAEIGARQRSLELNETSLTVTADSLAAQRRADAEIPLEEAVLRLSAASQAAEATMMAMSRLLSTNLTDYLR